MDVKVSGSSSTKTSAASFAAEIGKAEDEKRSAAERGDCGVYAIVNQLNGKRYVGSTQRGFNAAWAEHSAALRGKTHHSRHLQAAWNKYGEKAFKFVVVLRCEPGEVDAKEQEQIDRGLTTNGKHGYNMKKKE